jgi:predicted nuclease with TOPRIM domain
VAAGEIEGAVKDRIRVILRSPDMVARTFREVEAQADHQRAEMAGQKERLEARLAELKRAIGRLARSDGHDGALAAELGKLNEEYADVQTRVEEVGHALEALGAAGPTEDDAREALQKLDPLWDVLFPAEQGRIVRLLVQDIIVTTRGIDIRFGTNGIEQIVEELQPIEERVHA